MTRKTSGAGVPLAKVPVAAKAHDAARPTREQAFDAFCVLVAFVIGAKAETVYDQHHIPVDCRSSDAFKRRHRALRAAGVEGAYRRGKMLYATAAAWATDLEKPKLALVAADNDVEGEINRALGITTRGAR